MTQRLEVEIVGARIAITGRIDDSARLAELAPHVPAGDVSIDTGGVTFVSSVGMREWIRLVRALRDRGTVTLDRVADVLMTQLNLVRELGIGVRIASFYAPYACAGCGAEAMALVDAVAHAPALAALHAPPMPCGECDTAMALADFPERYLSIFRAT